MTREEAFSLIREIEPKRPQRLDDYLEITEFSEQEFYDILKSHRDPETDFSEIDALIEKDQSGD
jgi:hypothetical protein